VGGGLRGGVRRRGVRRPPRPRPQRVGATPLGGDARGGRAPRRGVVEGGGLLGGAPAPRRSVLRRLPRSRARPPGVRVLPPEPRPGDGPDGLRDDRVRVEGVLPVGRWERRGLPRRPVPGRARPTRRRRRSAPLGDSPGARCLANEGRRRPPAQRRERGAAGGHRLRRLPPAPSRRPRRAVLRPAVASDRRLASGLGGADLVERVPAARPVPPGRRRRRRGGQSAGGSGGVEAAVTAD
jgi:hypothetical protein